MLPATTFSVSIARSFADVYAFAHVPENFMRWAAGLAASMHRVGTEWVAETPQGPAKVRFSAPNDHGVLDHWVCFDAGGEVYIPLRVIANRDGAEVMLTLFRLPEMSDAKFEEDAAMVRADLAKLKAVLEA